MVFTLDYISTGVLNAERISHVVLDEADQLADDQNYSKVKNLLKRVHVSVLPFVLCKLTNFNFPLLEFN